MRKFHIIIRSGSYGVHSFPVDADEVIVTYTDDGHVSGVVFTTDKHVVARYFTPRLIGVISPMEYRNDQA